MSNTSLLGAYGDNSGSSLMFRNRIINGDMRIAQRGVQSGATASSLSNTFVIDRFTNYSFSGTARVQQTDITNLAGFNKALRYTVGSASTRHLTTQRVEGFNVADLAGQQITISFWVRGSKSFTFGFELYINTTPTGSSLVKNVAVTTAWQKIEFSFTLPATLASSTEGQAFETVFNWYPDQTTLTPSELVFVSGDKQGITGTTYSFNTANDWVELTGVQLEAGPTATPFERRPIGTEIQLCQRYYARGTSVNLNDIPFMMVGAFGNASVLQVMLQYPCPMRAVPTFARNGLHLANGVTGVAIASFVVNGANTTGAQLAFTAAAASFGAAQGGYVYSITPGHWFEINAEL